MKNNISLKIKKTLAGALASTCFLCLSTHAQWVEWKVSDGGNGHLYMAVPGSSGLTWNVADQLAQAQGGYLATITSQAENAFVFSLINSPQFFTSYNGSGPAIGGYQPAGSSEPDGGWAWVTGEAWGYSNWWPSQPDNGFGNENRLEFFSGTLGSSTPAATWNDLNENDGNIGGYVVELVPEPNSLALFGFAALLVAKRSMKQAKRM